MAKTILPNPGYRGMLISGERKREYLESIIAKTILPNLGYRGMRTAEERKRESEELDSMKAFNRGLDYAPPRSTNSSVPTKVSANLTIPNVDQTKVMDDIFKNNSSVPFISRIMNKDSRAIQSKGTDGKTYFETHRMANDGNLVYPTIVEDENGNLISLSQDEARERALETKEYIEFGTPEEASYFAANGYKKSSYWGPYEKGLKAPAPELSEKDIDLQKYFGMFRNIIDDNRKTQGASRLFNDSITMGELIHNINEPISPGPQVDGEVPILPYREVDGSATDRAIKMSTNATINQLRNNGMLYLAPSVMARSINARAENNQNIANLQAQMDSQRDQANAAAVQNRTQLDTQTALQNEQMRLAQEQLKGQAISQNLSEFKLSDKMHATSRTQNDDNETRLALMSLINKYPDLANNLSFLGMKTSNNEKE